MLERRRFRFGDDRGAATTELVMAMPAFLAMLFLVVQATLYFHARNLASTAAQEAAAAASELGASLDDGHEAGQYYIDQAPRGLWLGTAGVDLRYVDAQGNTVGSAAAAHAVEATVGGRVQRVNPFADIIPHDVLNLVVNERSQRPVERFRPVTE